MPTYLAPGVYMEEVPSAVKPIAGVGTSTTGFIGICPDVIEIPRQKKEGSGESTGKETAGSVKSTKDVGAKKEATKEAGEKKGGAPAIDPLNFGAQEEAKSNPDTYELDRMNINDLTPAGQVRLITNFTQFQKYFGGFSTDPGHKNLTHAVRGFFVEGGARCFVVREKSSTTVESSALKKFKAIDEIAIVCAPGIVEESARSAVVAHCEQMGDRFAILDVPEEVGRENFDAQLLSYDNKNCVLPKISDYAAVYFPWIRAFDPANKLMEPENEGRQFVPPSGHLAGVYARVDTERGVHKAPANENLRSALGLKYYLSKADQEGLNPHGVNCIRDLNGNIRVWGARTIGGDKNNEWKYINVRRLFLYLRESIDEGTQWVVFEPNTHALWGKILRNVSAFLTNVWRDGALFGTSPEEAFYVKCDEETNPPEIRDLGQVVTEIGVAVAKPAEFVIFRIQQWGGPKVS